MTNEEILKKAIEKAVENGLKAGWDSWNGEYLDIGEIRGLIFSHDFAKAFWGEEERGIIGGFPAQVSGIANWKFHLQKMVLEEDPIKYLERFLVPSEERK